MGIERRDDGNDYVYFQSGLCKPISEVGFLKPYEQYEEDCYDWAAFRREAAKDLMPLAAGMSDYRGYPVKFVERALEMADELIKQLKEYEQV